jgi:hypothetical protein
MTYKLYIRATVPRVETALRSLATAGRVKASTRKIAELARCSHWSVQWALDDLVCRERIEILTRGERGAHKRAGEYRILREAS